MYAERVRLCTPVSKILSGALLLALAAAACSCEGDSLVENVRGDASVGRCLSDDDCGARESCNVSIGICYPRDECGPGRDCPNEGQICVTDEEGFFDCTYERCESSDECQELTCPSRGCVDGRCLCGAPCQGGCPANQGCCLPTNVCHDLPEECMDLSCPAGQFVSVTSTGAWDADQCMFLGENCRCVRLPPLPLGDIGLYSALARDGQDLVMSAYNIDYGDLMFGIGQSDGSILWSFLDGVSTTTVSITGDVDGPRAGNSAAGPDVGLDTDIAVGPGGQIHIAYRDRDRGALKYAVLSTRQAIGTSGTRGWQLHTIEDGRSGETGLYSSLSLDALGRPRIAYLSVREDDGAGGRRSVLRLAFSSTTAPTSASDWSFRDIDTLSLNGRSCEHRCDANEVCLAQNQNCAVPDPAGCSAACTSTQRCISGACLTIDPLPPFRDLPLARGLWPSLQSLPDGGIMIAYHDRVLHGLRIAQIPGNDLRGGPLSIDIIDGSTGPGVLGDDTGLFPSLFVTPTGGIHVAYMNASAQSLRYKNLDAALAPLISEEVEGGLSVGGGPDGILIGADSALVVDQGGEVRIAYQDATRLDLRYARRGASATWTSVTLAGDETPYRGSFGFYTDQVLDRSGTNPAVSSYRYFLSAPSGPDNGLELYAPR